MATREYVLGTHDAEARRLGLQHRLWAEHSHAAWIRAGIGPRSRVLDVGCGPGYAAFDLAQIAAEVVAVDESARFVEQVSAEARARRLPVSALVADAQALPAALAGAGVAGGFDAAWARWVLCFVPDPPAVVRGVASLLRKGGRFAVHDYFNYEALTLAPRGAAFSAMIRAVGASFRSRGGDPDVAGRLPGLFADHGLALVHLEAHQRVARPGEPLWAWPDTFFRGYVPTLVEGGFLDEDAGRTALREWDEWSARTDVFVFLPTVFELIGEKR